MKPTKTPDQMLSDAALPEWEDATGDSGAAAIGAMSVQPEQDPGPRAEAKRAVADETVAVVTTERSAAGDDLPRNWLAIVAVVWTGQAASVFSTCAASFAAIWYITETTASPVWLSLASAAQSFHVPALSAAMPQFVPERHLVRINSMDQAITSLSSIAGPALGMLFYTAVGLRGVMLLDAACAAVACVCLAVARLPRCERGETGADSVIGDLREGVSFVVRDVPLRNLTILVMVAMLLFMPASSLSPLMVYQQFGGDGWQASIVEAAFGVGLLAGSVALMAWGGGSRPSRVIVKAGVVLGAILAACGLLPTTSTAFPTYAALMGAAAAAIGCFNAPILPVIQKRTPAAAMGGVMGIFLMGSSLAAPVGLMVSGFAAEAIGIAPWFTACGIAVAVCCAAALFSRSLRKLDGALTQPR